MLNFSKIGKLHISNNSLYMVTGYNYLCDQYTATAINLKKIGFLSHKEISKEEEKNLFDYENFYSELDKLYEGKFENKKYVDIYERNNPRRFLENHHLSDKDKNDYRRQAEEYNNCLNRLKETYINIKSIDFLLKHSKDKEQKDLYTKELTKNKKGLRRALKILYRYMNEDDYNEFMVYLENNEYKNIKDIRGYVKFELERKEDLIKSYEYLVDNYESFIESFRMF